MPSAISYWCEGTQEDDSDDDILVWNEGRGSKLSEPRIEMDLTPEQCSELSKLLGEFEDIFKNYPGMVTSVVYNLDTGLAQPVRLSPYRLLQAYQEAVKKELDENIIIRDYRASIGEWSAPIVLVKKMGHYNCVSVTDG